MLGKDVLGNVLYIIISIVDVPYHSVSYYRQLVNRKCIVCSNGQHVTESNLEYLFKSRLS